MGVSLVVSCTEFHQGLGAIRLPTHMPLISLAKKHLPMGHTNTEDRGLVTWFRTLS